MRNEFYRCNVFDIEIWADDHKIEPAADVTVKIRLLDAPEETEEVRPASWICTANLGEPGNYTSGAYRLVLVQNIDGQDVQTVVAEGSTPLEFPYLLQITGAEGVSDGLIYLYEQVGDEYEPRVTWPVTFEEPD